MQQNLAKNVGFLTRENEPPQRWLIIRNELGEQIFTYWSQTGLSRLKINFIDPSGLANITSGVPITENTTVDPQYSECVRRCVGQEIGIDTGIGAGAVAVGQPDIAKPFVTPGSSPGTSPASIGLRKAIPLRTPPGKRIWAPTATRPLSMTTSVGDAAGRWVPGLGWVQIASDVASISICVQACTSCPGSDKQ